MKDDFAPWAASPGTLRREPTNSELAGGFPCGPADLQLFNELFYRMTGMQRELVNALEASGLAADENSLTQIAQTMARYASGGRFAVCSGTANAIVLSASGSFIMPTAVFDGMSILFIPTNANTGPTTIAAFGITAKTAYDPSGVALQGGEFQVGVPTEVIYSSTLAGFRIAPWAIGPAQRSTLSISGPATSVPNNVNTTMANHNVVVNALRRGSTYNNATGTVTIGAGDGGQWVSYASVEAQDAGNSLTLLRILKNGSPIAYQDSEAAAGFKRAAVAHIGAFGPGDTLSFSAYITSSNAPVTIPLFAAGFAKLG